MFVTGLRTALPHGIFNSWSVGCRQVAGALKQARCAWVILLPLLSQAKYIKNYFFFVLCCRLGIKAIEDKSGITGIVYGRTGWVTRFEITVSAETDARVKLICTRDSRSHYAVHNLVSKGLDNKCFLENCTSFFYIAFAKFLTISSKVDPFYPIQMLRLVLYVEPGIITWFRNRGAIRNRNSR